jgi:hypothetical protein
MQVPRERRNMTQYDDWPNADGYNRVSRLSIVIMNLSIAPGETMRGASRASSEPRAAGRLRALCPGVPTLPAPRSHESRLARWLRI